MKRHALLVVALLGLQGSVLAENTDEIVTLEPLPEPLTLEAALAGIDQNHPLLTAASADKALAQSRLLSARSTDDLHIGATLEARHIDVSDVSTNPDDNDSRAILKAHKTLYDFGRTHHARKAAELQLDASSHNESLLIQQHRQSVIDAFFGVLLADLEADRANEAMALSYVRLDNARERQELGMVSDIDLLDLENTYQTDFMERQRAALEQRHSRTRLALQLGRPDELSSDLEPPELPGLKNPIPELEVLLEEAKSKNLALRSLQAQLTATQESRKSAKADRYPKLYATLQATDYNRETNERHPFSAILGLEVPIYQGERVDGKTASALAQQQRIRANMVAADFRLTEQVLNTLQTIQVLTNQLEQADIQADFRELYLDRSRAQYELEIKSDLGDAMVAQSEARRFSAQTRYDLALAREKLVTLTQNPAYSALQPAIETEDKP